MRIAENPKSWFTIGLLACGLAGVPAAAQETEPAPAEPAEHFHKNELVFILGVTCELEAGDNLFTIGGEYGRKFTPRIGAAAAFEHLSHANAWVFVFPVAFRVHEGFHVSTGPGIEHLSRRSGSDEPEGHAEEDEPHGDEGADNLFLWRAGAGYLFEFGERYIVSVGAAHDWVFEEHVTARAWLFGMKFAIAF